MEEINVRIVKLDKMRAASFFGFGQQPEDEAWRKLEEWAKPKGYLDDLEHHRIFGFNNPSPSPVSPNYGYEFLIAVDPDYEADEGVKIIDFPGGLYAVTNTGKIDDPGESIPAAWKKLSQWRENSKYRMGQHQWLEEHPGPAGGDWSLDLYIPIVE